MQFLLIVVFLGRPSDVRAAVGLLPPRTWRCGRIIHQLFFFFKKINKHCSKTDQGFSQVYSFVPIPGAQQHKRPRRRYEEIERMYKCGWNGCEKAYGTLNHLNAHVTMQSHGAKRTPEGELNKNIPYFDCCCCWSAAVAAA